MTQDSSIYAYTFKGGEIMIKRTPQEIADFFGCYVAMDADGDWFAYSEEPLIYRIRNYWDTLHSYKDIYLRPDFINPPANHDWTILYEPRPETSCKASDDESVSKKEKAKKLVPYDLNKKEDRDALRGKWVVDSDEDEYIINAFYPTQEVCNGVYLTMRTNCGNEIILFENYTFLDGSPVGKEVEE